MKLPANSGRRPAAFTLIELLLVIAVIGIMSALVVTALSNASGDAHTAMARQQQAVMQEALNAWIAGASSGSGSLSTARASYNANSNKLTLISSYLDPLTSTHMADFTASPDNVQSEAMTKIGQKLQFTAWAATNYPTVQMVSAD